MRALRVVGITEGGGESSVVLEDSLRRERFTVPADEQLRAAARGDLTRLGQISIELESQLRPREIQARIRAGASVEQVAAAAGVPMAKIERFAYPVLLERSRTAEVAQRAHPLRADGPDRRMLGDVVAYTFGLRGQEYQTAEWDSWKGEDGRWVIALSWRAGRSDNRALWTFQPGAHGGTVTAIDEHAHDLVEGLPARPLRTVGPVIDISRPDEPTPSGPPEEGHELRAAASDIAARRDVTDWARTTPEPRRPDAGRRGARPEVEVPARRGDDPVARAPYRPTRPDDRMDAAADPGGRASVQDTAGQGRERALRPDEPATEWPIPSPADHRPTARDDGRPSATTDDRRVMPTAGDRPVTAQAATGGEARTSAPAATPSAPISTTPAPTTSAPERVPSAPSAPTSGAPTPSTPGGTADPVAPSTAPSPPSSRVPATSGTAVAPDAPDHFFAAPRPSTATGQTLDRAATETVDGPAVDPNGSTASESMPSDGSASTTPTPEQAPPAPSTPEPPAPKRTRKGKPVMPSWDEVLLGVRSQR